MESAMNQNTAEGKLDQLAGKVKQTVGEAIGNQHLANSGAADQVKGAAKETVGKAQDTAQTIAGQESMKDRAEATAHNVREKITSTAQDLKARAEHKLDELRDEHTHNA